MNEVISWIQAHRGLWLAACAAVALLVWKGDALLAGLWGGLKRLVPQSTPPAEDKLLVVRDSCRELCRVLPEEQGEQIKSIVAGCLRSFL